MPAPDPLVIVRLDQVKLASGEAATFGAPLVGYACPSCGQMYTPKYYPACNKETPEEKDAAAREAASRCCYKNCEECDCIMPPKPYCWTICEACRDKRDAAREAAKYEKAEKVDEAAYSGFVYWEDRGSHNGYFDDLDELRDWAIQEEVELPTYVYACSTHKIPTIDAGDIVESALENQEAYEDAISDMDVECLQKLLDFWLQYNQRDCFQQDDARVVILSQEENAKFAAERQKELADWEKKETERERAPQAASANVADGVQVDNAQEGSA